MKRPHAILGRALWRGLPLGLVMTSALACTTPRSEPLVAVPDDSPGVAQGAVDLASGVQPAMDRGAAMGGALLTLTPDPVDVPALVAARAPALVGAVAHGWSRGVIDALALDIDDQGVDPWGRVFAPPSQSPAPDHVLTLLDDVDFAEAVLAEATPIAAKSLETRHTLFKLDVELSEAHAAQLGVSELSVMFKPLGTNWYGEEYKRELLFYRLARYVGAGGVVPLIERDVAWAPLAEGLLPQLTDEQHEELIFEENADGEVVLHGSAQLWVEGYDNIIGHGSTSYKKLELWAARLDLEAGRYPLEHDVMWPALSDMFLLDALVDNDDRAREVGAVRRLGGRQRLIMLDHGDALVWAEDDPEDYINRAWDLFARVRAIRPATLEALTALDEATLRALWTDARGALLTEEANIGRALERLAAMLEHIQDLEDDAPERVHFARD